MKSVPFEVCFLDPLQNKRSRTPKLRMNSLSPCPVIIFFYKGYAAAQKDSLANTCTYRLYSRNLYRPVIVSVNTPPLMRGRSNMRLYLYRIEMVMIAYRSILWVSAFNVLMTAPIPICHLLLISGGLKYKYLFLDVKFLWAGTSWCWTSKASSSG